MLFLCYTASPHHQNTVRRIDDLRGQERRGGPLQTGASSASDHGLDHAMGLVNGIKDERVPGVVLVLQTVVLQREGHVVDVGHIQGNICDGGLGLDGVDSHEVKRLLHGRRVDAAIRRAREGVDQGGLDAVIRLVEINGAGIHLTTAIVPLDLSRGTKKTISRIRKRSVLASMEVREATLGGLQDLEAFEAGLDRQVDLSVRSLLAHHHGEGLLRSNALECVLVLSHSSIAIGGAEALPVVLGDGHGDLVHDRGVLSKEVAAEKNTKLLNRLEVMLAGNTVDSVLAGVGGDDDGVVAASEGRLHAIALEHELDSEL